MIYFDIINDIFCRPHDRVSLKEMKADWHACLDNKVGFKVSNTVIANFGFIRKKFVVYMLN